MPNVFTYLDYRKFLADFYQEQKKANPAFSYQYFVRKAGFKSKSYLPSLIEGKRNLTQNALFKLQPALKLGDKAFGYFAELVAFNQASSSEQRAYHLQRLMQYNRRNPARKMMAEQYELYDTWYHSTVRELATSIDFRDDYPYLASRLSPPITARQARASVQLLLRLGLIRKSGRRYKLVDETITTGDEARSLAVRSFHQQNLRLAGAAIDNVPSEERDISCVVMRLSDRAFASVKSEIQQFRKKLLGMGALDTMPARVYHIGMQLFPTSQLIRERTRP